MNDRFALRSFVAPVFAVVAAGAVATAVSARLELDRARGELDTARRDAASLRVDGAVSLARAEAKALAGSAKVAAERDALKRDLTVSAYELAEARAAAAAAATELDTVRTAAVRDKTDLQKRLAAGELERSALRLNHESTIVAERRRNEAEARVATARVASADAAARTAEARARSAEADAAAARSAPPVIVDNTVYNNTTTIVRADCPPSAPVVVVRPEPRVVRVVPVRPAAPSTLTRTDTPRPAAPRGSL